MTKQVINNSDRPYWEPENTSSSVGVDLGPALLGVTCVACGQSIAGRGEDGHHGCFDTPAGPVHREGCEPTRRPM